VCSSHLVSSCLFSTGVTFTLTTKQAVGVPDKEFAGLVANAIGSSATDSALCSFVVTEASEIAQPELTSFLAKRRDSFFRAAGALEQKHSHLVSVVAQQLQSIESGWSAGTDTDSGGGSKVTAGPGRFLVYVFS
jgi:hypothetical protein